MTGASPWPDDPCAACARPSLLRPVRCLLCPVDLNEKYRLPLLDCVDREWLRSKLGVALLAFLGCVFALLLIYVVEGGLRHRP